MIAVMGVIGTMIMAALGGWGILILLWLAVVYWANHRNGHRYGRQPRD